MPATSLLGTTAGNQKRDHRGTAKQPPAWLLEQSKKRKSGNKPVKCNYRVCNQWFIDRLRMSLHKIRHHG